MGHFVISFAVQIKCWLQSLQAELLAENGPASRTHLTLVVPGLLSAFGSIRAELLVCAWRSCRSFHYGSPEICGPPAGHVDGEAAAWDGLTQAADTGVSLTVVGNI